MSDAKGAGAAFKAVKSKQALILAAIVIVLGALAVVGGTIMAPGGSHSGTTPSEPPKTLPLATPVPDAEKNAWIAQAEANMRDLTQRNAALEGKNAALEKRLADKEGAGETQARMLEDLERRVAALSSTPPPTPAPAAPVAPGVAPGRQIFGSVGTGSAPTPARSGAAAPRGSIARTSLDDEPAPASSNFRLPNNPGGPEQTIADDKRRRWKPGQRLAEVDEAVSRNRADGHAPGTYLPAGTFARATLLNGIDAATSGSGQQNPTPMLLRLDDHAVLPNGYRADLKSCFVTANAAGDLSSERAMARLDRLSCIDEDGNAIDISVRGYIADEGGYTGIRGRLVTKTGQMIANSLLAAVVSGLGEGISSAATVTTYTPIGGVVQTPQPGQEFRAGFGQGFSRGAEKIADYYLNLANSMFPIIEVDAGRSVDVVFTRGVSVERESSTAASSNN